MSDSTKSEDESPADLYARIRPLMDAVDLDNLSQDTLDTISTGELGGEKTTEDGMRLMELRCTGVITGEQCRALIPLLIP